LELTNPERPVPRINGFVAEKKKQIIYIKLTEGTIWEKVVGFFRLHLPILN
jgi:hypothetical protein